MCRGPRRGRPIQRAGEAQQRLLVPEHPKPRVPDRGEHVARAVDGAVVDDDPIEIVGRLTEDAPGCSSTVVSASRAARTTDASGVGSAGSG